MVELPRTVTAEAALERMRRVAADVAQRHAASVDATGRFPSETFDALRAERLLGVWVPTELGGEGLSLTEICELVTELSKACGSSGMIYGMHQIKMSSFVSHGMGSAWHRDYMRRIVEEQLLMGSATTEGGIGGDLRNSICAIEVEGDRYRLTKQATCISYGNECDAILATCRRAPDAASSDQVMVVIPKGTCTLRKTFDWDTMGMRGTRSEGFELVAEGHKDQIFPLAFSEIAAQSMLAMAHIIWTATWFGIAADAVARAQSFVKAEARKRPGTVPPGALRLSEATVKLQSMKSGLQAAIAAYDAAHADADKLSAINFLVSMTTLKIASSELAPEIVQKALLVTGLNGYRNDSDYSVARHMRDVLSAAIMISNDRILANTSNLLLISRFDTTLVA